LLGADAALTLADLFFLASVLFVLILCGRIVASVLRRRGETTRQLGCLLGVFVALYAAALIAIARVLPRRFYAPGERRCFDEWCVTALDAEIADGSISVPCQADRGGRIWVATVEVSSVAKRVRQCAPDPRAELEDRHAKRYQPCAAALIRGTGPAHVLSDEVGPGESFAFSCRFGFWAA